MLSDYGLGALGRLVIQCYTLVSHLSPLVTHLSPTHLHFAWCAWCASTAPTQQHWTGRDKKQRPSKEGDQLQQTSTSSTCPKKRARGRQEHQPKIPKSNQRRAGKGKGPGNLSLEKRDQKTRSKRDANEIRALAAANSRKVKSEGWITWRRSLHGIRHWRSTSRQNPAAAAGRTQEQQAEPRSSRQNLGAAGRTKNHNQAQAGRTRHKRAKPSSAEPRTQQQQAAAGSSRQNAATAGRTQQQHAEPSASGQNQAQAGRFQQAQIPTGGDRTIQNLNMISFNGHASHGTIDNDTIKIAINTIQGYISRIMSRIHCPQRWNSIQINSQSNKEKNYQNLNETLRARRCDTSGHLVRRKPSSR